jgi:glutamyl-tRNA reductase
MLAVLGISYKSAPVSVRELYAFDENERIKFIDSVRTRLQIEGIVILSTCNRSEIYLNTTLSDENEIQGLILEELMKFKNISVYNPGDFYFFTMGMAVEQLFKVTSGIESMVLGEEQILGQVKDAFRFAQNNRSTDCVISRLFIKAIEAGKRVRTETHINRGAASVSYAAVELCNEIFSNLQERTIMVVGAGQTGDLILQCMLKKNHPAFYIANRTFSRANELAEKYSGTAIGLPDVETFLSRCDIVIAATSSKEHLITREMVAKSMAGRKSVMQVYIDLSVPSNIESAVNEIENVHYYGVDDLKAVVTKNVERRKSALDHSMTIISEVKDEFMEWMYIQNLTPIIISIKENMKNIQQTELDGYLKVRKIKEPEMIENYSEHISEKYAQIFIKKLKKVTENGKKPEYIKIINDLFEHISND